MENIPLLHEEALSGKLLSWDRESKTERGVGGWKGEEWFLGGNQPLVMIPVPPGPLVAVWGVCACLNMGTEWATNDSVYTLAPKGNHIQPYPFPHRR